MKDKGYRDNLLIIDENGTYHYVNASDDFDQQVQIDNQLDEVWSIIFG